MLRLYDFALIPLRPVGAAWTWWRGRTPEAGREWRERWARDVPAAPAGGWWIHGASLGEAGLVRMIAAEARRRAPTRSIAVSAMTRAGREALPDPPGIDAAFFAPLDFPGLPARVLASLRPTGLVLVETELWPNLIREARAADVPVAVVNGRLAPERMGRYRRLASAFREVLLGVDVVGAQSSEDAARFRELGVAHDRVTVTGNLKYDLPVLTADPLALRRRFGLDAAPVRRAIVAGSTAEGEEAIVLRAFDTVRARHPDAVLFVAPRRVARADEVAAACADGGRAVVRLTDGRDSEAVRADVVVVDTLGELAGLYALADVAFVGGSLVPVGGHNVLEPARVGVPVTFGDHVGHVREPAEALVRAGGAVRVGGAADLAEAWIAWIGDAEARRRAGAAALAVVDANRGALTRTVDMLESAFARSRTS